MRKRLTKHGNSLALVIDRGILDLLKIRASTPLDVSTDGSVLIVAPARSAKRNEKFTEALALTNRKYGRLLKRLAS